jgi:hypothetical protein
VTTEPISANLHRCRKWPTESFFSAAHQLRCAVPCRPSCHRPGDSARSCERQRKSRNQRTASTYIFGPVCPKQGKGAALVLPTCNTMNLHLVEIAATVAPGVLLVDQAGWHLSTELVVGLPDRRGDRRRGHLIDILFENVTGGRRHGGRPSAQQLHEPAARAGIIPL